MTDEIEFFNSFTIAVKDLTEVTSLDERLDALRVAQYLAKESLRKWPDGFDASSDFFSDQADLKRGVYEKFNLLIRILNEITF